MGFQARRNGEDGGALRGSRGGLAGLPGSEFSPSTRTKPRHQFALGLFFFAQSSAPGQELESHKLNGPSKSRLCQRVARTQTSHHSATRLGQR